MADITTTVKDGMGFGDNSKKNSKTRLIDDNINIVSNTDKNTTTEKREVFDFIMESGQFKNTQSHIPSANDKIELISDSDVSALSDVVSNRVYEEFIALVDGIEQNLFLSIISPLNNNEFLFGSELTFSGIAIKNGVNIPSNKIKWSSSLDGVIEIGNNFSYNLLSIGAHRVKMCVDGEFSSVEINIKIIQTKTSKRPENLTEV
jgi:hypothetical protein